MTHFEAQRQIRLWFKALSVTPSNTKCQDVNWNGRQVIINECAAIEMH